MVKWLGQTLRGMCMGVADLVPGVSGGTVALILGIYSKFIGAVSAIGPSLVKSIFTREFWRRVKAGIGEPGAVGDDAVGIQAGHFLFLVFLAIGILLALVIGVRFIPDLLRDYPEPMNGLFFGLVLASMLIPYRQIKNRRGSLWLAFVVAAVGTFILVGSPSDDSSRAKGELVVTFTAPLKADIVLTRDAKRGPRFMTDNHPEGKDKREIAFIPNQAVTIPAKTKRMTIPVIAKMRGTRSNIEAGALTCSDAQSCGAKLHLLPESARVEQAKPMEGGTDPSLIFVFVAGIIAISAMVLPGISGSFILLLFGLYAFITFNLRAVIYDRDPDAMIVVAVFGAAVVIGIATFSRFLSWMLARYHDWTMAALIGLMLGSLRKLWPFTSPLADGRTENVLPPDFSSTTIATLALFVIGLGLVLTLEYVGRKRAAGLEAPAAGETATQQDA